MSSLIGVALPLDEAWIGDHPAFHHDNPRVVRACIRMFVRAWGATPPGTLPSARGPLSELLGLTENELLASFQVLTTGWELTMDGRLSHAPMVLLAEEILNVHGKDLMTLRARSAAVGSAPDLFGLSAKKPAKTRGNTQLPADFAPDEATVKSLITDGFTTVKRREWLLRKFVSHFRSSGEMRKDWQLTLVNFSTKEAAYTRPWNQRDSDWSDPEDNRINAPNKPTAFSRFGNQKEAIRSNNAAVLGLRPGGPIEESSSPRPGGG